MSGSTSSLTDTEKVSVRKFCGYPAYGSGPTGDTFFRTSYAYTHLEYMMANLLPPEMVECRAKLKDLAALEAAIPAASCSLGVQKAAVFQRNMNEIMDRVGLFNTWRRALCAFLGVPPGPEFDISGTTIRMVV